ncbi:EKC/KEOPS complex subunit TPRKB-like [Lycorma delicatula]|uniref:EKC/KEOPS complex subunit TPRKB-like n=1 Tax=Lycorma delicatula TaxID=130591 RepID=UPI003F513403
MEMLSFNLDFNYTLYCNLAVGVKNLKDVKKSVINGDLKCALINPKYIIDVFQIAVAANRAIVTQNTDKLLTKTIYTEIIYNLSPSKTIKDAIANFGVNDVDTSFLVCVVGNSAAECEKTANEVCKKIDATFKFPSSYELKNLTDENTVLKCYKISPEELKVSNLLNSVVTRISSKGFK